MLASCSPAVFILPTPTSADILGGPSPADCASFIRTPFAVCASQGVDASPEGLKLISEVIKSKLGITMAVLMGANIANEVADEKFCETTIGGYG